MGSRFLGCFATGLAVFHYSTISVQWPTPAAIQQAICDPMPLVPNALLCASDSRGARSTGRIPDSKSKARRDSMIARRPRAFLYGSGVIVQARDVPRCYSRLSRGGSCVWQVRTQKSSRPPDSSILPEVRDTSLGIGSCARALLRGTARAARRFNKCCFG